MIAARKIDACRAVRKLGDEELTYANLTAAEAHIERSIPAQKLPRLCEAIEVLGQVDVILDFERDPGDRPMVAGSVSFKGRIPCNWCLAPVDFAGGLQFSSLLADSDTQAQMWDEDNELLESTNSTPTAIVVAGAVLDVVDLIEDELLLQMPTVECAAGCEEKPLASYGESEAVREEDNAGSFAALQELKDAMQEQSRNSDIARNNGTE